MENNNIPTPANEPNNSQTTANRNTDISTKNATLIWGVIFMVISFLLLLIGGTEAINRNGSWIYYVYIGASLLLISFILLGIGAVVERLNAIIKLMNDNKNDKTL